MHFYRGCIYGLKPIAVTYGNPWISLKDCLEYAWCGKSRKIAQRSKCQSQAWGLLMHPIRREILLNVLINSMSDRKRKLHSAVTCNRLLRCRSRIRIKWKARSTKRVASILNTPSSKECVSAAEERWKNAILITTVKRTVAEARKNRKWT